MPGIDQARTTHSRIVMLSAAAAALVAGCPDRSQPPPTTHEPAEEVLWEDARLRISARFDEERSRGFLSVTSPEGLWVSATYHAWKAVAGEVDGDGRVDVLLGVMARRKLNERSGAAPRRSVWVLSWDGQELRERWRGSAFSRPLLDFTVGDLDGAEADELLALESWRGGCHLQAYRWNDFGFVGTGHRAMACEGLRLDPRRDGRAVHIEAGGQTRRVTLHDGHLGSTEVSP